MSIVKLRESVADAPTKKGNRWRVIVARPGEGSSGKYSEDLFRRDAYKLIAPGAQSFIIHDEARNPKDMIGTFPDGGYFDEDLKAVVAELEVFSHWKEFVEEVGPHCGISLYASGLKDDDNNVTEILENPYNGADLVARPGLEGSGFDEKLYESAVKAGEEKDSVTVAELDRSNKVEKKVDEIFETLTALKNLIQSQVEEQAKAKSDADAVEVAVEHYDAAVKAVEKAELFKSQRDAILAEAKAGRDVEALIESAVKVKEEALDAVKVKESQEDAPGVVLGESVKRYGAWA